MKAVRSDSVDWPFLLFSSKRRSRLALPPPDAAKSSFLPAVECIVHGHARVLHTGIYRRIEPEEEQRNHQNACLRG